MSEETKGKETPAPPEGEPSRAPTSPGPSRRFLVILLVFLGVSQSFLLVAAALPEWWAALPVLSLTGVVGWRGRWWALSPVLGFAFGAGYWGVELALLPVGPRGRLAGIIASGAGLGSPTTALLIGPLLLGVLAALGALTVTGGLRAWEAFRSPEPEEPAAPTTTTEA